MGKKLRIWHISDPHGFHEQLVVPESIDVVICSGDISNYRESYLNEPEVRNFLTWYNGLNIKYKILVAGNHDVSIERRLISPGDILSLGIMYLENESTIVEGIKFWGSPITPSFGVGWAFNKDRGKIHKVWDHIPEDVDIIITHGPPQGMLDLSFDRNGTSEYCGCKNLAHRIEVVKPKLVCFGHIHDMPLVKNQGIRVREGIIYSNGSVVHDGDFTKTYSNGNLFEIDVETKKINIII